MMYDSKVDICCVCSDKSVSKRNDENYGIFDIPYPVYNQPSDIKKFLQKKSKKSTEFTSSGSI